MESELALREFGPRPRQRSHERLCGSELVPLCRVIIDIHADERLGDVPAEVRGITQQRLFVGQPRTRAVVAGEKSRRRSIARERLMDVRIWKSGGHRRRQATRSPHATRIMPRRLHRDQSWSSNADQIGSMDLYDETTEAGWLDHRLFVSWQLARSSLAGQFPQAIVPRARGGPAAIKVGRHLSPPLIVIGIGWRFLVVDEVLCVKLRWDGVETVW
jgi:hypothetical protein